MEQFTGTLFLLAVIRLIPDTWDSCCSFLYTHNWWHVALVLLLIAMSRLICSFI